MSRGVCPSRRAAWAALRHNASARQHALRAADHALLPAPPPLVSDVIQIVVLRRLEQDVVARPELVDELEVERSDAIPMLACRHSLEVDLRTVLADLRLEQLVDILDLLLQLLASLIRVLAEYCQRAFVAARHDLLEVDAFFLEQAMKVRQLGKHADGTHDRKWRGDQSIGHASHQV